jgi:hypothetical protein
MLKDCPHMFLWIMLLGLVTILSVFLNWDHMIGVPPHRHQAKVNLYHHNEKNAILFGGASGKCGFTT